MIFDEEENPEVAQVLSTSPASPDSPFPTEAQRTAVNGDLLPVPFDFGWLYLNLNTSGAAAGNNPPEDPAAAQAWVTVVMDAEGRFSMGYDAIQLDNARRARHQAPND